jgi:hypothetical protein
MIRPFDFRIYEIFGERWAASHTDGLVLAQPVQRDQFITRGLHDVLVVQHRPAFSVDIADRERALQFVCFDFFRKSVRCLKSDIGRERINPARMAFKEIAPCGGSLRGCFSDRPKQLCFKSQVFSNQRLVPILVGRCRAMIVTLQRSRNIRKGAPNCLHSAMPTGKTRSKNGTHGVGGTRA